MPRAALTLVQASEAAAAVASGGAAPDAAGAIVPPNSIAIIRNGSGGSINVTTQAPAGTSRVPTGIEPTDRVTAVPAGATLAVGPWDEYYTRPVGPDQGQVYLDFSAVASVTAFAVQLPR